MRSQLVAGLLLLLSLSSSCTKCDSIAGVTVQSESHRYIAGTRGSSCGPLLSEFDSFIQIERPYTVRGYRLWTATKTVAGGKLSLSRLKLRWEGDDHLLVDCDCSKQTLDFAEGEWRDVAITYNYSK